MEGARNNDDIVQLDDGCSEEDIRYFIEDAPFPVRALCLVCRLIFNTLSFHDKIAVKSLLANVSLTHPSNFHAAMNVWSRHFIVIILRILRQAVLTGVSANNYCGIAINEIEEYLDPSIAEDDGEPGSQSKTTP
jgi:hypothetical protein